LDGFRGIAEGRRMLSKNGNRLGRFDRLLVDLPRDLVLDGEIIAADGDGRPQFEDLMFGRRPAEYVVFDVLRSDGRDLRQRPLWRRKMALSRSKPPNPRVQIIIDRHGLQIWNPQGKLLRNEE
jgi:ATP-dependent DNA ligase